MFLFGLYYRAVPRAGESRLAKPQAILHIIGAILFPIGIVLVTIKGHELVIVPIVGSLIGVSAVILFAAILFQTSQC